MKKSFSCFPGFCAFCILTVVFAVCGCIHHAPENQKEINSLTLMTWNIHNLFDGNDDGNEYAEFLQAAGWSSEKYMGRVNAIADAIRKIEPLPDIIMFQEIESRAVLDDLAAALHKEFTWSHFAGNYNSAIGLGIISRFPLLDAKSHSITIEGDASPRPVLETRIQTAQGDFIIFTCHWKSKIGGDDITENTRRSSARVILRRIREIWESEPKTGIIAAGDLNENFNEFFRQGSSYISALLPDDPHAALAAPVNVNHEGQKDFIVVTGAMPPSPVHFPAGTITLFSPWADEIPNGSYYYRNAWETIDHFLISHHFFDGAGWEYRKAYAADFEPFVNSNGVPVSYNSRTGGGLSDHLPLLLILTLGE